MITPDDFQKKWLKVMDSPDGEVILAGLLEMYAMRTSHTPGDPYQTAFHEGERNVVNFLLNLVRLKGN
jgi:hypothetical protein